MKKSNTQQGRILSCGVLTLLTLLSVVNVRLLKEPAKNFAESETDFADFTEQVGDAYTSDGFLLKNQFINLNGAFARVTGRRTLNDVIRCENGMLARVTGSGVEGLSDSISEFSEYLLENENIPFLYIQAPCKENLEGLLPEGVTTSVQENTDILLSELAAQGVNTLDLRPEVAQTTEQVEKYYYRTDHHWNSDGAFTAFQTILSELAKQFPEANIDLGYTELDRWERHEKANWFLGSLGKRVGQYFGGTDSLIWYTPRFDTEMSCTIPKYYRVYSGDFTDANIRSEYIEEKDYFGKNPYCVYIGGDYPLVQHRNLQAPSDLKILWLRDSFTLPLQSYLSTVFQEIDVIDPRHWSESTTLAEYVAWTKPDVVIMMINPSSFAGKNYRRFGLGEQISQTFESVEQFDVELQPKEGRNNYAAKDVLGNSVYRVSFDGVNVTEGETQGVSLALYNATTKKILSTSTFDLSYYAQKGNYTWTFKTPETEDRLQLLFYAGLKGATGGNGVLYEHITLSKAND